MAISKIGRRALLGVAGAAVAAAFGKSSMAQQTTPVAQKGPPVWLDMDQADLDAAYDQSVWAPNRQQVIRRFISSSDDVRKRLGPPRRFRYGPTAIEALDVYPTSGSNAPINIFIHGGAWRERTAKEYGFPAELFVGSGAHYVVPDFAWVQEVNGSLAIMAKQLRRALAWVYRNARAFGGDPSRIYLSGHSSGAHLVGVLLTTDWVEQFGLPQDLVKAGLCASGMFDLKPVRLSARSRYITFDDEMENELSPQRHLDKLRTPLVVAYGSLDSPEFQRQSRDFASAVRAAGKPVQLLVGQGYNHLEILETLSNPYGLLGRAVLDQMQLNGACQTSMTAHVTR